MAKLFVRPRGTFALKPVLALTLVASGDLVLFQNELFPAGLGILGLAMAVMLSIAQPAVLRERRALFALALAALYSFTMIYDASPLAFLLCGIALGTALLLPRTGTFDDGWRWAQRLALHGIFSVPGPFPDLARISRVRRARAASPPGIRQVVRQIVLPISGTLIFIALFAAANPVIDGWIARLSLPQIGERTIGRIVLWAVLVWASWWLLRPKPSRYLLGTFDGRSEMALPGVSTESVLLSLIAFNAVFLIQNGMDAAWLWGLLPLPEGITLAEYAHRGAYPLVVTAVLTALFVLVALRPGSSTAKQPLIRNLVVLWIGQNLFLVFNAALRTIDYVEVYSLTVLRIAALLWMALVAVALVLVLWRMLAGKSASWLINSNLAAAGILLTAVCFVDLGAIAAQWNVRHAREAGGRGAPLDLCYLNSLGGSALLPLVELEKRNPGGAFGEKVYNVRRIVQDRVERELRYGQWQLRNYQRLGKATTLLGGDIGPRPAQYAYSCDGRSLSRPGLASFPPTPTLTRSRDR